MCISSSQEAPGCPVDVILPLEGNFSSGLTLCNHGRISEKNESTLRRHQAQKGKLFKGRLYFQLHGFWGTFINGPYRAQDLRSYRYLFKWFCMYCVTIIGWSATTFEEVLLLSSSDVVKLPTEGNNEIGWKLVCWHAVVCTSLNRSNFVFTDDVLLF